jgi:hypothetical protein
VTPSSFPDAALCSVLLFILLQNFIQLVYILSFFVRIHWRRDDKAFIPLLGHRVVQDLLIEIYFLFNPRVVLIG